MFRSRVLLLILILGGAVACGPGNRFADDGFSPRAAGRTTDGYLTPAERTGSWPVSGHTSAPTSHGPSH